MKTWQAATGVLLVTGLLQSNGFAQSAILDQLNPLNPNASGLHISNVTLSSSRFSESFSSPSGLGPAAGPSGASAMMLQGAATFNWARITEKSTVSATYSPSYMQQFQLSNYRSFNQSFGVSVMRRLGTKLVLTTSFQGLMSDFTQSLFAPTLYGNLSSTPASFEELVSAMLAGQSSNPGLAQLISTAPVNGNAQTAFLYGGRELSASANASLLYALSSRSSFTVSMQAMRTQFLNAGSSGTSSVGPADLIPATTMGSASAGWNYSLTPRTTLGVNVSSSRVISKFEDAYSTQVSGFIGRTLSTRWFVQAMLGAGYVIPERQTFASYRGAEPEFGGSVGFKFKAQTLLGSYNHTVADSYALGAEATQSSAGAWSWNRPGSSISLSASFGYSHLTGPGLPNVTSWTSQAGFTKRLQSQLVMTASYSYVQYPETLIARTGNLALSGVMVGLSWSPSMRR